MIRVAYLGLRELESAEDVEEVVTHEMGMAERRLQLEKEGTIEEIEELEARFRRKDGPFSSEDIEKLVTAGALEYRGLSVKPKTATESVVYEDAQPEGSNGDSE